MNLTELAYKYQKLLFFIIAMFAIYGAYSYFTLPAQEDPSITIREAVVSTSYPGMSPERVELLITKKLEENIRKSLESFFQNIYFILLVVHKLSAQF